MAEFPGLATRVRQTAKTVLPGGAHHGNGTCFIAGVLGEIDSDGGVLREWRLDRSCGPQVSERERRQAYRLWQQGSVHTTPDNHRLLLSQQTLDLAHHAVQRWYASRATVRHRPPPMGGACRT
ncbi:hypothetical protein ACI2LC_38435 [Nonomuraea wenchangensis]|uniref:hypothetical protein n=1 Tax=Nonomuraea wenchangensis TaxID=568860 RepID=UPI0033D8468A